MTSRFHKVCIELTGLIDAWEARLTVLPGQLLTERRNRQQRTIKEIVGHMVDSATNNTHRIIHLHYQQAPVAYPDYANLGNNDRWIAIQNYQGEDWNHLVHLWAATNRHIVHLIQQVDEAQLANYWTSALGEEVTLEAMILDYPRHFKLHIKEIEELI